MNNVGTAYVLWLGCLLQLHGLQRLYNGKIFTGLLWMFTFGLFGVGQLIDLLLIPGMVEEHNIKLAAKEGHSLNGVPLSQPAIEQVITQKRAIAPSVQPTSDQLTIKLLKAAETRGGKLSVTQGVMETGASFEQVETSLKTMLKTGYVDVTNDPETGVVMYEFKEL
ncbi:NINE protein [Leptolyngbya sp. FACHB-36]|uniref:NINE protein n=1 Tax=Leptolyngbya sp. FACHB-36 TaxID=2692808 RepID=UPI001680309E|nr:NINE protein [Leptolyngbya sp. FACHB-36]MBD2020415.1 NINE protein [Leptolyngbya sp. FACHB-36]